MDFSNSASDAAATAPAYTRAMLALLGDRDPLEIQAKIVPTLRELTLGLSDEDLRRPEAPGKWSILGVVQHLADSEMVYGYRYRAILTEDEPEIAGYDQDAWAENLGYDEGSLDEAIDQLAALRTANLRLLRSLEPEQWQRGGLHSERGRETIERIAKLLAAHDLVHCRQIERTRRALGL